MEDPPCFTKLLPGSAGHPHAILNSGISGKGNSLLEKGSRKHGLGFIITVWLPILANPDVRATQPGEKSPLLWPHCCAVPLFPHLQNSSFDRLCLCSPVHAHEGQWAWSNGDPGTSQAQCFSKKSVLPFDSLTNKFTEKRPICWTGACKRWSLTSAVIIQGTGAVNITPVHSNWEVN